MHSHNRFSQEYHISSYPNLSAPAKRHGFFNYNGKMTRYIGELYEVEFKRLSDYMKAVFDIAEKESRANNSKRIPEEAMPKLKEMIRIIRHSVYPQQLKEEFYLKLLSWRNGKHLNNTDLLQYISFFTFYLRPPLTIEKYLVAAVISNESLSLQENPLCLVSDINKATELAL